MENEKKKGSLKKWFPVICFVIGVVLIAVGYSFR